MSKNVSKNLYDIVAVVMTAVITVSLIFVFAGKNARVEGRSMEPTLAHGDALFVSSFKSDYKYGDIVIAAEPNELNKTVVKRVIACENQWVDIDFETGDVYVGDDVNSLKKLSEKYIAEKIDGRSTEDRHEYPVRVPEGCYFLMGDNRNHSTDSRSYRVDFVNENYIVGKALFRLFPFGNFNIYLSSD